MCGDMGLVKVFCSLHRLAENGLLYRQIRHWHPKKPECIASSNSFKSFNIGMEEVFPSFMLLVIGAIVSLLVLTAEYIVTKVKNKTSNKVPIKPFIH